MRRAGTGFAVAALAASVAIGGAPTSSVGAQARATELARPQIAGAREAAGEAAGEDSNQLLLINEGNRMRRVDLDSVGTGALVEDIFIERGSSDPEFGRDVNGQICLTPDGNYVMGEDTGQPSPPPGWGVFSPQGRQIGKLAATYYVAGAEPHGCAVDADGRLFTGEVGNQASGDLNGQLMLWFPPYEQFPGPDGAYPDTDEISENFCKLATDVGTATGITIDRQGRVYMASPRNFQVLRFSPPFPTAPNAAGGCGATDALGSPVADNVNREVFLEADGEHGMLTYTGLALAPNGNIYTSSVITGRVAEYTTDGEFVRMIVNPPEPVFPTSYGTPQSLSVGPDGTVYYADLNLRSGPGGIGPGPNGKAWRVRFDANGDPMIPEIVREGLAFPDGVRVVPGNLQFSESRSLAGGPLRQFARDDQSLISPTSVRRLRERWRFQTGQIVTGSPAVVGVRIPGEGLVQVVYFTGWDGNVYAVRFADGSELWRVATEEQPGASYPAAASVTVHDIRGRPHVIVGMGEIVYALDAATGAERWRFTAGTGCRDEFGNPPGLCGLDGERNGVESTAIVSKPTAAHPDGVVLFGMDVNDRGGGKGGVVGVDAHDGRMVWYFDLESGGVCTPNRDDNIRRYDGYHTEAQLGLPTDFFATRSGCTHPRSPNGCGNVWSSPAYDADRSLMFVASSNCDTDDNPNTPEPPAPMPPYDEALFALDVDTGTPAWRWRAREVDNADLAYGAAPNLFAIDHGGEMIDVVGIGNKDGTYTVIDRDGVNEADGTAWDDPDAVADLPYWRRQVVPGGPIGGIPLTASADEVNRRIHFATAPGFNPLAPQRPTIHALDMDSGAVIWQNTDAEGTAGDASFSPTSGANGVIVMGGVQTGQLRVLDAATGELLFHEFVTDSPISGVATGATIVDGNILVGGGIGQRGRPGNQADAASRVPNSLVALCVSGAAGCPVLVPIAPTAARATATLGGARVDWDESADDGGAPVSAYLVTASPGGAMIVTGPETRHTTYEGLDPAITYTFTVAAQNSTGSSEPSAPTAPVRPIASSCSGYAVTIVGTADADVLIGTPGRDVIAGLGGNDLIASLGGNDVVCGGSGDDLIFGAEGANRLRGDSGNDIVLGGAGNDRLRGDRGRDALLCGAGHDAGIGGSGADFAFECEVVISVNGAG